MKLHDQQLQEFLFQSSFFVRPDTEPIKLREGFSKMKENQQPPKAKKKKSPDTRTRTDQS